jgi:phosphatidylethanolamine/phosphatidyl-N-methylethanolamine N-methyltransferase
MPLLDNRQMFCNTCIPRRALARRGSIVSAPFEGAVMVLASAYDDAAPAFDRHRALPGDAAEAIRQAVLAASGTLTRPRLLDLGAGTGRIGWPFIRAGDDYVGVDLSLGMLREFARRSREGRRQAPRLVQADGEHLPFQDATFDAVMLIQIFGGMRGWRRIVGETRRVLRSGGSLVLGRSVAPPDGVDAQMKQQLTSLLGEMGIEPARANVRDEVRIWLQSVASDHTQVIAATWTADRTPRAFVDRHRTGARFSALPAPVKDEALHRLGAWATTRFGSLDTTCTERHEFELRIFRFR